MAAQASQALPPQQTPRMLARSAPQDLPLIQLPQVAFCQEAFKPAIAIDAETGHALNNGTAVVKLRLPCMSQAGCRH